MKPLGFKRLRYQPMHNIYIYKHYLILIHVSMHPHHLQGVLLFFYFVKVTKIIKVTNTIKS